NCQLSVKQVNPRQYVAEIPQVTQVMTSFLLNIAYAFDGTIFHASLYVFCFSHQMVFLAQVSNLQCSLCLVLSPTRELAQQWVWYECEYDLCFFFFLSWFFRNPTISEGENQQEICVSSIFLEGKDINMSISHAADSIGLKEIPRYEVKIIEEDDWMKGAQALEPATLVPLQLLKSSGTKCIM
ncbi:hypothetical protein S83_063039, partial [Arachis hypogaea]